MSSLITDSMTLQTTACKTVRTVLCPACPLSNVGVLWPNGWTDQDATWYNGRPRPRRHYVRWGPISPLQKRGTAMIVLLISRAFMISLNSHPVRTLIPWRCRNNFIHNTGNHSAPFPFRKMNYAVGSTLNSATT